MTTLLRMLSGVIIRFRFPSLLLLFKSPFLCRAVGGLSPVQQLVFRVRLSLQPRQQLATRWRESARREGSGGGEDDDASGSPLPSFRPLFARSPAMKAQKIILAAGSQQPDRQRKQRLQIYSQPANLPARSSRV